MTQVTPESVATAAWELQRAGENPSVRAVTDKLGSGSATTIHKHLKAWKEQMAQRARREPMPEVLARAQEDAWQLALDQAQAQFDIEREEWEAERAGFETTNGDLRARIAELEQASSDARGELQQANRALQDALSAAQTLTIERDQFQAQVATQTRLLGELQEARAEAENRQDAVLQRLAAQFDRDIERLKQSGSESEARLMLQLDQERQRTKAAEKETERVQQAHAKERKGWDDTRTALHAAHQEAIRESLQETGSARAGEANAAAELRVRREQWEQLTNETRLLMETTARDSATIARLTDRLARCSNHSDESPEDNQVEQENGD